MVFMSQMMRNLMLDLLDFGQIERGTFKINNEYFNLVQLIPKAFDMLQYHSSQKNIKFVTQFNGLTKYFTSVYGDERRYMQILINFLSNALKFSPKNASVVVAFKIREMVEKPQPKVQGKIISPTSP